MPKLKTKKSIKKRFKITGTGKVLRRRAGKSHKLEVKSSKRKRGLRHAGIVASGEERKIKAGMPYC